MEDATVVAIVAMNATERAPYLEAADAMLLPLGFKRKKKEFEWRRVVERDTEWIHLNFGLGVINPSFGARYADVEGLFPAEFGVRCGPSSMVQNFTAVSYSTTTTPPAVVARDLLCAVAEFPKLRDRQAFTELMMSDAPATKFVMLFSERIRMLPAMLASLGRREEAMTWLVRFEAIASGRDQQLPSYEVYAAYFRSRFQRENG